MNYGKLGVASAHHLTAPRQYQATDDITASPPSPVYLPSRSIIMETLDEFLRSQSINLDDLMDDEEKSKEPFYSDGDDLSNDDDNEKAGERTRITTATSSTESRAIDIIDHHQENELVADSLIRNSFVGPKVVRLSMTYNSHKTQRRMVRAAAIIFIVLLLSIYGFSKFNKLLWSSYSHEAILDIESKNIMTTTTTAGVSASSGGATPATTSDGNR